MSWLGGLSSPIPLLYNLELLPQPQSLGLVPGQRGGGCPLGASLCPVDSDPVLAEGGAWKVLWAPQGQVGTMCLEKSLLNSWAYTPRGGKSAVVPKSPQPLSLPPVG